MNAKTLRRKGYAQEYYKKNKDRVLKHQKEMYYADIEKSRRIKKESAQRRSETTRKRLRIKNKEIRIEFLNMYGNKCICCGETLQEFLTLEHINGQRGIKRSNKETGSWSYRKAIKEYRPDLYEILCWNCNCSKGRYGYCPHQNK